MFKVVEVRALDPYKIWLRYEDGTEGALDLSDLAGKGVFEAWENPKTFEDVRVGEFGEVSWGEEIDLCPDALYMRRTGRTPEELFLGARATRTGA